MRRKKKEERDPGEGKNQYSSGLTRRPARADEPHLVCMHVGAAQLCLCCSSLWPACSIQRIRESKRTVVVPPQTLRNLRSYRSGSVRDVEVGSAARATARRRFENARRSRTSTRFSTPTSFSAEVHSPGRLRPLAGISQRPTSRLGPLPSRPVRSISIHQLLHQLPSAATRGRVNVPSEPILRTRVRSNVAVAWRARTTRRPGETRRS